LLREPPLLPRGFLLGERHGKTGGELTLTARSIPKSFEPSRLAICGVPRDQRPALVTASFGRQR